MGSSKTKTRQQSTSTTTSGPTSEQSSDIRNIFNQANNLYNTQQSEGAPNYNTYAPLNGTETQGLSDAVNSAQNALPVGNNLTNLGSAIANATASTGTGALNTAAGAASAGVGGNFDKGTNDVSQSLMGLAGKGTGTTSSALGSLLPLASTDPTSTIASNAGTYANNSAVQNLIKNANAFSDNLFNYQTGTNMNAEAVNGGNLNSSRAGAAQAVADALQSQKDAETASDIENNAYTQGLDTAKDTWGTQLSSLANAASLGNDTSNLALSGQTASNSLSNQNNTTLLDYINQLANIGNDNVNAANTGSGIATSGQSMADQAATDEYNAGNVYQTNQQSANDANLTNQENQRQYYWDLLNNLYNLEGNNLLGTTETTNASGTSTTKSSPSIGSIIQGIIGTGAGLASAIRGNKI